MEQHVLRAQDIVMQIFKPLALMMIHVTIVVCSKNVLVVPEKYFEIFSYLVSFVCVCVVMDNLVNDLIR